MQLRDYIDKEELEYDARKLRNYHEIKKTFEEMYEERKMDFKTWYKNRFGTLNESQIHIVDLVFEFLKDKA